MGSTLLIWFLKLVAVLATVRSSYKALRQPTQRRRRPPAQDAQDAARTALSAGQRTRRRAVRVQLTNWVVLASFVAGERVADRTVSWILPLYDELKIVCLVSILAWRSAGAELVYRKMIRPAVAPYERPLDGLGFLIGEALDVICFLLLVGPRWIRRRLERAQEPEVPSILRSLRAPGRPPIAHHLADTLEGSFSRAEPTLTASIRVPARAPLDKPSRIIQRTRAPAPPVVLQPPPAALRTTTMAAPFRPTLHQSRSREPVAGPSRSAPAPSRESYANVYPVLPPPVNVPAPVPASSTRTRPSTSTVKGKGRALDQLDSAAPTRARRSNPSCLPISTFALPTPPSPPAPFESTPPRLAPPVPDTPAPPGAFTTQTLARPRSPPKPLRNPCLPDLERSTTAAPSPKQLALSAIQELAKDVVFDFGSPARRRAKARQVDDDSLARRKRKVSQMAPDDDADDDDDGTETATEMEVDVPAVLPKQKRASKVQKLDSARTNSADEVVLPVRTKPARVAVARMASSRVPVPKAAPVPVVRRKARRVLGTNGGVLSDREEDGVPVVNLKRTRPA